ncbi:MAG: SDR family NAD(P)-dependent oxidoreductase [Chthoniobacterales bacterium]
MEQTVVVAGVGPGLGAALVRKFSENGGRVALLARSEAYLTGLTSELSDRGLLALPTDLAQPDEIAHAFAQTRAEFGPIDILICHASASSWSGIEEISAEEFERAWRVTVLGAFLCCKEVVGEMIERGNGVILFTGATSAIRGRKGALGFSSAKFGLRGLADSLARELWPKGIHVAHIVIDGEIGAAGAPQDRGEVQLDPDAIAASYFLLAQQERGAWSFEIDVRPNREDFFV